MSQPLHLLDRDPTIQHRGVTAAWGSPAGASHGLFVVQQQMAVKSSGTRSALSCQRRILSRPRMAETAVETPPRLFVSYSWTSPQHAEWVLQLATELRESGVD